MSTKEKFGAFTRRERQAKQIGLRQMAKMIGVSPTYLSKIERDELPPPAEDKVLAIARIIECDPDRLLAVANRVASDLLEILKRHSSELPTLLREIDDMWPAIRGELCDIVRKAKITEVTLTEKTTKITSNEGIMKITTTDEKLIEILKEKTN